MKEQKKEVSSKRALTPYTLQIAVQLSTVRSTSRQPPVVTWKLEGRSDGVKRIISRVVVESKHYSVGVGLPTRLELKVPHPVARYTADKT